MKIEGKETKLQVFGDHNLLNLNAAWLACKELGITSEQFAGAIHSFTGAAKRLELIYKNEENMFYRDFAHAPSKVKATIEAVKNQFPEKKMIAVLELHTYSSLNEQFMNEYNGSLEKADVAAVFYSKHALELKRMPELKKESVKKGFSKKDLDVINNKEELEYLVTESGYYKCCRIIYEFRKL